MLKKYVRKKKLHSCDIKSFMIHILMTSHQFSSISKHSYNKFSLPHYSLLASHKACQGAAVELVDQLNLHGRIQELNLNADQKDNRNCETMALSCIHGNYFKAFVIRGRQIRENVYKQLQ